MKDLLIIGGGVTGAAIAWDAALRGLSVAVVEKNDFAWATSAASSKLIHGGLRYLQNFELGLVRESLRERRLWCQNAPHMVYPLSFIIPTYGLGMRGRAMLGVGLTLYDLLAYDRNRLGDPDQHIPHHRSIGREEALRLEPGLEAPSAGAEGGANGGKENSARLTGAMIYHDCQMYSPERLALELLLGAIERGAEVHNHTEVTGFLTDGESSAPAQDRNVTATATTRRIGGARVRDAFTGAEQEIRARVTINAAGPWADLLMDSMERDATAAKGGASAEPHRSRHRLIRSKGIHLLVRNLTNGYGIAAAAPGGGHFFILPWRGYSILGTTDTVYEGHPDDFGVTEEDIRKFLAVVNVGFPGARLRREDVLHFYGGMRPLVDKQTKVDVGKAAEAAEKTPAQLAGASAVSDGPSPDSYRASRASEVYDHAADGLEGVVSAIGGKWTTSRHLAEQVVDLVIDKLGPGTRDRVAPCATENLPTGGGDVGRYADFEAAALAKHSGADPAVIKNLVRNYGSRYEEVLRLTAEDSRFAERVTDRFTDIGAQVIYAVRNELARTLEDVLFRRTGLGTLGSPGDAALQRIADLMGGELGWDDAERDRQLESAKRRFAPIQSG